MTLYREYEETCKVSLYDKVNAKHKCSVREGERERGRMQLVTSISSEDHADVALCMRIQRDGQLFSLVTCIDK